MSYVRRGPAAFLAAALLAACAPPSTGLTAQEPPGGAAEPPRLLVMVVVDQLRGDLLERYDDLFTGGLRRLLDEGRVFPNATHDHLVTETAPGHATLSTGTHPARHGVVSNQWFERRGDRWVPVENVIDPATQVVTDRSLPGASPESLERSGLADWMEEADDRTRVVAVSGKPRGAVLLAGRTKGQVYWFEPLAGRFVTSTWYRNREAGWVREFNERVLPGFMADSVWESTVPPEAAVRTRPDSAAGEGVLPRFPHRFSEEADDFWSWFNTVPALDRATLLLARRAVEGEDLGEDEVTDLLTVSLSQTDRVGHRFGPGSREQLDNLLRLDRELGRFFEHLDRTVGEGRWAAGFSSDHGAQDTPEEERARGVEAVRLSRDSLATLQDVVTQTARAAGGTGPTLMMRPLALAVVELPWIARAWTHERLAGGGEPADSFEVLARNSYYRGRASSLLSRLGVEYMLAPHVLPFGYEHGGSTHQTGYYHDRHVPFILLGPEVTAGRDQARVSTADFAPTLAGMAAVPVPDDLDGVARGYR